MYSQTNTHAYHINGLFFEYKQPFAESAYTIELCTRFIWFATCFLFPERKAHHKLYWEPFFASWYQESATFQIFYTKLINSRGNMHENIVVLSTEMSNSSIGVYIANKHISANIVDVPPWTMQTRTSAWEREREKDWFLEQTK